MQKIPLDAGLSCPNRDGTLSRSGCIFCDRKGSGSGAMIDRSMSIEDQVLSGIVHARHQYGVRKFIAYFQSFTNTYGPLDQLKVLYDSALSLPEMVGLSVATRPDCVDPEVLGLLRSYGDRFLVWVEFGLQSAHDETLKKIGRGHDVAAFERAVMSASRFQLNVCAHVILGLPGENRYMMHDTARYLGQIPINGVKIHLLYVVKGTPLATLYERGEFRCLERDEYAELAVDFLELLPPEIVIQRLTGDPFGTDLLAPEWALEKGANLQRIREKMEERQTWQGKKHEKSIARKSSARS
ncbi:MAG: TIGR01212 family radical SAM protein [Desulfobacterales bacterium]|nr:TIGR01212 family radical SAM protein [Desulfobacterales bacterium]